MTQIRIAIRPAFRMLSALFAGAALLLALVAPADAPAAQYETLRDVRAGLASDPAVVERVGGGTISITFAEGAPGLDRAAALNWIRGSAQTVSDYFGRFPVDRVAILVVGTAGSRIEQGTAWGYSGSTIRISVGRDATAATYARDWKMVHEMAHLALPNLPENQSWALEGSATYAEPIARARLGKLTGTQVWEGLLHGLPNGLPRAGDLGLDQTPTWGRTYWGGALFYFVADVRIRQATGNRKSLRDAFVAINRASGGNQAQWTMDRLVAVGDRATGTAVLTMLYAQMGGSADAPDLDRLFADLGVSETDGEIRFNNQAPLVAIRKAITAQ
ncbi:MAG: hypothetical protein ABI617_07505 [Sphingomicrobium sp.]